MVLSLKLSILTNSERRQSKCEFSIRLQDQVLTSLSEIPTGKCLACEARHRRTHFENKNKKDWRFLAGLWEVFHNPKEDKIYDLGKCGHGGY